MTARGLAWRACYEFLARRGRTSDWSFMNYGFAPAADGTDAPALSASDEPDRLSIQLYLHALRDVDLTGMDVLEVGSGRGGGASYLSRCRGPHSVTGLDFSQAAVDLCNRERRSPGLTFVHGDAQAMPFPDESFDAVVNIESSHCYQSVPTFLQEVARVLRPGGHLFFADLRGADALERLQARLRRCPLTVQIETDITSNVLAALRLDNERKLDLIQAWIPRVLRRPFRVFAAVEGTKTFDGFEKGRLRYLSAHLTKPGTGGR